MKLKRPLFMLIIALAVTLSAVSIKNIDGLSLSGFSAITANAVRTVKENNITLTFIVFFLVVLVSIGVLEYLGYPVMSTIKSKATTITKKFKK